MRRIVLLREGSGPDDPYERALRAVGLEAESVPVLQFQFVNAGALREALLSGRYGHLVLTSPRALDAIERVGLPQRWVGETAWTVGEETARRAARLGLRPRGEQAGSAAALALRVALDARPPLLFVCGDRRREELPSALRERSIAVDEIVAYETHLRPPPLLSGPVPYAVGFFSPSGVDAALRDDAFPWHVCCRVAIGLTTARALANAGRPPHAAASAPTPEAFAAAAGSAIGPPSRGA